tara:strand:+ start:514 stop:1143 length:630 start_codon:yes stop_codon:yes gene_type:complete
MGFDLYGENPQVSQGFDDNKSERYEELCAMTYEERHKEGLNDEYFELQDEYQNMNPGNYFRNNVWWWRPLWDFVCHHCHEVLTQEDMNAGCYNDNHLISKAKSIKIAKILKEAIETEETKIFCEEHEKRMQIAKKHNAQIEIEQEDLRQIAIDITGDSEIYPAKYPKKLRKKFDELVDSKDWASSYPFSIDNVKGFIKFAEQSGGFTIC